MSKVIADEICHKLASHPDIEANLVSIIWFGYIHNDQDVHAKSDCDLQVVLNKPDLKSIISMNQILEAYPEVDLSIMYMQDIFDKDHNLIFHDGTKSLFFIHVLAAGTPLYGINVYVDIAETLTLEQIKPSLLITIREYLGRLRVMATRDLDKPLAFKKYSLKMFKDILVFHGIELPENITRISNSSAIDSIKNCYDFSEESKAVLHSLLDYEISLSRQDIAYLLVDYEEIVKKACNE